MNGKGYKCDKCSVQFHDQRDLTGHKCSELIEELEGEDLDGDLSLIDENS
jgi:DNA-directed RNA polymerase subunit RPC12/RpoP